MKKKRVYWSKFFPETSSRTPPKVIFACGPSVGDRRRIPKSHYRRDEDDIYYFRLNAPLYAYLDGRRAKVNVPVRFIVTGETFWGGSSAKDYRSKVIAKPTYRSLLDAAQRSLKATNDYHHLFIEGCSFAGYESTAGSKRQVMLLQMNFGS